MKFILLTACVVTAASQAPTVSGRMTALVELMRPLLPYPAASADGELPADNSASSKWFVVWPTEAGETRIVIRANPLHPDTQKATAEAMNEINAAVAAAERRAQAAYDKAIDELRRTGKAADLEVVTLDDEGVAGERIDAELEVVIELTDVASFEVASSEPPVVESPRGATWRVRVPANTYRAVKRPDAREHFRAAEAHIYFGAVGRPDVQRSGDEPLFRVTVAPVPGAFRVVLRGNQTLVTQLADADWSRLQEPFVALLRPTKRERVEGESNVSNLRVELLEHRRTRRGGAAGDHDAVDCLRLGDDYCDMGRSGVAR